MHARTPEETHALLAAAFNAGDLDAFVAVYDDDATLMVPPDGTRVSGKAEIRRHSEPLFALRPAAEIKVIEKLETDGLALTLANWTLDGTGPDGQPVELAGRGSIVSRRQPDGSWRIVLDIPVRPQ
jgi:uncharacterized protein (TIGR02246 family)